MNDPVPLSVPHDHPADKLAASLLDDGAPLDDALAGITGDARQLSPEDRRRIADLQWLDALLGHDSPESRAAVDRSVARVLAQLAPAPKPAPRLPSQSRRRWIGSLAGVAASLLFLAGLVWWRGGPDPAYALVQQAWLAALETTDRTYRISFPNDPPAASPRFAELTVRGGERFVCRFEGPLGRTSWIGGNRRECWFARPVGPVLVADSQRVLPRWMKRTPAELPFLQLTTILERLRNAYELEPLPAATLPPAQDAASGPGEGVALELVRLRATRRAGYAAPSGALASRAPDSVELWTEPQTGVVRRLILVRPHPVSGEPQTILFELTSQESRPDAFYGPEAHAPGRAIVRLPSEAP